MFEAVFRKKFGAVKNDYVQNPQGSQGFSRPIHFHNRLTCKGKLMKNTTFKKTLLTIAFGFIGIGSGSMELFAAPDPVIYRMTPTGSEDFALQAIPTQSGTVSSDGQSLNFYGVASGSWIACGPYINLEPGSEGIGHVSAEVDLEFKTMLANGGSLTLDIVAGDPLASIVLDSTRITSDGGGVRTIRLRGGSFTQTLPNLEVRVGNLKPKTIFPGAVGLSAVSIKQIRIIYN